MRAVRVWLRLPTMRLEVIRYDDASARVQAAWLEAAREYYRREQREREDVLAGLEAEPDD